MAQLVSTPVFRVLGVRVHAFQIPDTIAQIESWIAERGRCHLVAFTGMHGVSEAQHDSRFKQILNSADAVVPDGMPLVWLGRHYGYALRRRVYGPEVMETFCRLTGSRYRHYLYGGKPGVAVALGEILQRKYGITVAGVYSPPFRPLTKEEDEETIARIHAANPDVLWVGLSTPKQERWMYAHRDQLHVPVLLGVGAAFDLNSGNLKQAPNWMRESGLEWAYRFLREPKRLWRRYALYGPEFVWRVTCELLSLRNLN